MSGRPKKSRRRGAGEGSITKLANGTFRASITLGYGPDGRQRFKTRICATQKAAITALAELRRDRDAGRFGAVAQMAEKQTVAQYLQYWLTQVAAERLRPNSRRIYGRAIVQLSAHVGHLRLAKLTPQHLHAAQQTLLSAGSAPASVALVRTVAIQALDHAVTWKLLPENPARAVPAVRVDVREPRVFTPEEATRFLAAAKADPFDAFWHLALIGLREGELLGLRWSDVDLDTRRLQVRWSLQKLRDAELTATERTALEYVRLTPTLALVRPKTAASQRQITLPAFIVAAIRRHRARQLQLQLDQGTVWRRLDLLFCTGIGTPLHAKVMDAAFHALLARAALPTEMTVHGLRHSAATLLLINGVDARTIMQILGHTSLRMFTRYTHVVEALQEQAADALDEAFGSDEEVG